MVGAAEQEVASSPLLQTKLYVPRPRPGAVRRPRLIDRLNQAMTGKLTLVSAPAGFGKTTLLAEWLASDGAATAPAAWVALDQGDNDPTLFWAYVVAALRLVQADIGQTTLSLLHSPQAFSVETLLGPLLNELSASSHRLVLVLDDYHTIDAQPLHRGIAFLLDHLPPQLHVVIASRADPPLPLSRLRARGELAQLRAADLRFTADEGEAFLNEVMGLHLTSQAVAALEARTEGWIAGLQLAALSMQGRDDAASFISAFTGDDRYIVDYLVEEVLQRQSERVRSFLLQTSILHRLNGPLCDAVTGQEGSRSMLEFLDRGNLFVVPLDDRRGWYRYHQLFADVLTARAMEEQPDRVPLLHRRASEWYARNGQPADAIRHALAAGDFERAAGLVEFVARTMVRSNQSARLREWLDVLPDDLIRARPVLSTYCAFVLLGVGELGVAEARLLDAERWLSQAVNASDGPAGMVVASPAELQSLPGTIALARSFKAMALGDRAGTLERARQAMDRLPADDDVWRGGAALLLALAHWAGGDLEGAEEIHDEGVRGLEKAGDIILALSAAYDAADLRKARGRLSAAGRIYERSLRLALEHGDPALPGIADLHLGLSELYLELNDLQAAARHLELGGETGKHADLPQAPARRCVARARLREAQGDLDGALGLFEEAERIAVIGIVPDTRPIAARKARVWIRQGRLADALDWARRRNLSVDDDLTYLREFEHITLARLLLRSDGGSMRAVRRLLERLIEAAEAGGRTGSVVELLVLQALAPRGPGDLAAGLALLERALALAGPEGYVRVFVDEGVPMRELLRHAVARGIAGDSARRVLSALDEPSRPVSTSPAATGVAGLAEPLTARELEILRLIAAGMRNQQIADHLVISLSTVKRHIANTYGKLGVDHRTEAVARLDRPGQARRST